MEATHRLDPLDHIMPPLYEAFIYGFPCPTSRKEHVIAVLRQAWTNTLNEWPILRGLIQYDESKDTRPGSLNVRVLEARDNDGFVVNHLDLQNSSWHDSYEDLRAQGMPPNKLDGKILAPLVCGIGATTRVVTLQLNFISGGCLLAFCSSHSFMDAKGCSLILKLWAKHCRDLQAPENITEAQSEPILGMRHLNATKPRDFNDVKQRSELWHLLGLHATENLDYDLTTTPINQEYRHIPAAAAPPGGPVPRTCIFSITPPSLQRLKQDASPKGDAWVSSSDALVALLWRCIMRARFPCTTAAERNSLTQESIVTVAIDGRKLLSPPVPSSYVGNVVFCCMTRLPLNTLLAPTTPLAEAARSIRKNIESNKRPQIISDIVDLAAAIPDTSSLKIAFKDFLGKDLITTSWIDLPFYDIEFGPIFGDEMERAEFFRIPRGQFGGICCLLPKRRDGVVEVSVLLEGEQMRRLREDEEFAEYVGFVAE